jgi:Fur family transcriptional regulator, peroxide stress response regulator
MENYMSKGTSDSAQTRLNQMLAKLEDKAFRLTPQRLAVLEVLATSKDHPSVSQVHTAVKLRFPTTSLATVYKTVLLLKELNEVLELGFPDSSNRYDGLKPGAHPHVICTRCRRIMDPELATLKEMNAEIEAKTGYQIQHLRMDFFGLCPVCKKK